MQYIKQELTEFTSTNLTDSYPDWSPLTEYIVEPDNALTLASIARDGSYYYRSVSEVEENKGFTPSLYENLKWVKHSVSNKYAMLDMSSNSKSVFEGGDLTVTFLQNQSSILGIGNYEADFITIDILAPDGTTIMWTYNTPSNTNANVYDYYDYIYEPYNLDQDFTTKINLPIQGRYVRLTFHKLLITNRAACGYLIVGNPVDMGMSLMQPKFGYNSLTTKDISTFGNLDIKKSFVQDIVDFETVIASTYLSRMRRELKKIYDEIVLFIIDERDVSEYENLMTLGVIQDASVVLENNVESVISFSVIEAL